MDLKPSHSVTEAISEPANSFNMETESLNNSRNLMENRFLKVRAGDQDFFKRSRVNSYYAPSIHRTAAENFIRRIYQQHYHADIRDFYPHLLSLETIPHAAEPRSFHAIAGLRCAEQQTLFAEYYLEQPIEQVLAQQNHCFNSSHIKPNRHNIMEIGNLALEDKQSLRWLISALIIYLFAAEFQQVIFTAIPVIANSFKRLRLPLYELADASREKLPQALQQQWQEDYYQLKPKVYSMDITQAYQLLIQQLDSLSPQLKQFCHKAFDLGSRHYKVAQVA